MTNTHTIPKVLLMLAILFMSISYAHASEVIGTLSSGGDPGNTSHTDGSLDSTVSENTTLSGTVVTENGGSTGSSRPQGSVLGESITRPTSPSFPNAGFAPGADEKMAFVWSATLIGSLLASFFIFTRVRI
jgi:hypothetical protein